MLRVGTVRETDISCEVWSIELGMDVAQRLNTLTLYTCCCNSALYGGKSWTSHCQGHHHSKRRRAAPHMHENMVPSASIIASSNTISGSCHQMTQAEPQMLRILRGYHIPCTPVACALPFHDRSTTVYPSPLYLGSLRTKRDSRITATPSRAAIKP